MRAVCYARVSSAAQRDRETIASQLRMLPEYIARQGWELVAPAGTYVDDGRSAKAGQLERRTGLAALLRDAALGLFDVVAVVAVDRLTRSEDLAERGLILGAFQKAGVRVASAMTGQVLDFATELGDLVGMFEAFGAASWGRKHRQRISEGKLTAIARGKKPAGPTPYGLAYDRATGLWSVDPITGAVVHEMYVRVAAGETCEAIAIDLEARGIARPRGGMWIRERVWAIVTKRTYAGEWTADKARGLTMPVPPIVTEELWQRVQLRLMAAGRRGLRRTKHVYLLESIAVCGACGAPMGIRSGTKRGQTYNATPAAYVCSHRRRPPRGVAPCMAPCVPVADADARVWDRVRQELEDPDLVQYMLDLRRARAGDRQDAGADASGYRAHLERLDKLGAATLARHGRGLISEGMLEAELARIKRERDAVRAQLDHAENVSRSATASEVTLEDVAAAVPAFRARAAQASPEERRRFLAKLVSPGGVVFRDRRVVLDLRLGPAATAESRGELALVSSGASD